MKKIFLMSLLSIAVLGMVNAQSAATTIEQNATTQRQLPQVRAKAMVSKINNACQLQGDQVGKVNQLYIDYFTKLDGLGTAPESAKLKELSNAVDVQLKTILTPSQLKLWQAASSK